MRKRKIYFLLLMLLGAGRLMSQDITFTLLTRDSDCNGANNGRAEVNVVPLHPPYSYLWNFGNTNHSISGLGAGNYSVTITDDLGNDTLVHVTITEKTCTISPDLVFTPNSDGYNDTWRIANIEFYPDNLVLIYNRWGQKIFESKGVYEPWEGKDQLGIPVTDNAYFYIIYADSKDEKSILKGSVTVIR